MRATWTDLDDVERLMFRKRAKQALGAKPHQFANTPTSDLALLLIQKRIDPAVLVRDVRRALALTRRAHR